MLIDITVKVTPNIKENVNNNLDKGLVGHVGTHFDVMDKEFPIEYAIRKGVMFDVSNIIDRDINENDIDLSMVTKDMFVIFYTGYIEKVGYGNKEYFGNHPQLSNGLIDKLLEKQISMIGVDLSGVRRGKEHTPKDQYCADRNVFIIENLCNLYEVISKTQLFNVYTFPMNYSGITGLPCRVMVEI